VKLLLTGFEPFGGARENPSAELLKRFRGKVDTVLLPNAIRRAPAVLMKAVERVRPDVVLHLGESREAREIIVERGAVNVLDTHRDVAGRMQATDMADNDGNSARNEPVVPGAPRFLRSTMPVEAIARDIKASGIPVRLRDYGGMHVSNQVFYGLLYSRKVPRVGYIHIPPVQHRAGGRGMPIRTLAQAVAIAIETLAGAAPASRDAASPPGIRPSSRRRH
jgi:pyroglutamyl-peptidase